METGDIEALQRQLEEAQRGTEIRNHKLRVLHQQLEEAENEAERVFREMERQRDTAISHGMSCATALDEAHAHMRLMRDWMRGADWDAFIRYDHPEAATWDFGEGGERQRVRVATK